MKLRLIECWNPFVWGPGRDVEREIEEIRGADQDPLNKKGELSVWILDERVKVQVVNNFALACLSSDREIPLTTHKNPVSSLDSPG